MHAKAILPGLIATLCLGSPLVYAQAPPPCGEPIAVADKPVLRDFQNYSDFVVAVMAHTQAQHQQQAHARACPEDYQPAAPTPKSGPQSLQSAMREAEQREPLDYQQHPTWHNRSTSHSFALPALPGSSLADQSVRTLLANIGSDHPQVFPLTQLSLQTDGIYDGLQAQQLAELFRYQDLPLKEREALFAGMMAANPQMLADIMRMGNLTFFFDISAELINTHALIVVQSCFSSGCPDQ